MENKRNDKLNMLLEAVDLMTKYNYIKNDDDLINKCISDNYEIGCFMHNHVYGDILEEVAICPFNENKNGNNSKLWLQIAGDISKNNHMMSC